MYCGRSDTFMHFERLALDRKPSWLSVNVYDRPVSGCLEKVPVMEGELSCVLDAAHADCAGRRCSDLQLHFLHGRLWSETLHDL